MASPHCGQGSSFTVFGQDLIQPRLTLNFSILLPPPPKSC